ncbi:alpha/beta hydrolase family protein [Bradyrhizobium sp. CCBAU 51627]|uniref:alpha/beta hydrolase family protein n=1 Tax=Bradyrhizobium sp. CCBAU 51627 TaxID=1325088 RepID=UPI002304E762|nr:alpha/beta fold hydrolase [Bradyrhizobium sp. CCBAU 51627]
MAAVGAVLILLGGMLAHFTQTTNGIRIEDVRFKGAAGNTMSALIYIPPNPTERSPAPGILAVHGYINSRETQDGFAIEFARRGYVVVALDQTGHGYSDPPAFAHGFGGPDGLAYLRSLPYVDKENIGLEGHSMGGWTILAAAAAMPDAYKSLVLEGSSTGKPFAAEGTPTWPRNLAVVFSQYDEFSQIMWGSEYAKNVPQSGKLAAVFGAAGPVEPGRLYGDIGKGTARVLYTPAITHPADHFSHEAIGDSLDWFGKTLTGGTPLPSTDQIWLRKEIGTLIALIGFFVLLLGAFDLLLTWSAFAPLRIGPARSLATTEVLPKGKQWWVAFWVSALLPAVTYYPAFALGNAWLPASRFLPQAFTTDVMVWALLNTVITLALLPFVPKRTSRGGVAVQAALIALATVAVGVLAVWLADLLFKIDFRFWVVALKLPSPTQLMIMLIYLVPFTLFFMVALRTLHANFSRLDAPAIGHYVTTALVLSLGFVVLIGGQYLAMWLGGKLINPFPASPVVPLSTIIGIQFIPLLAAVAVLSTFTWRRTGTSLPGALICGLLVTWYMVAGTATQAAL